MKPCLLIAAVVASFLPSCVNVKKEVPAAPVTQETTVTRESRTDFHYGSSPTTHTSTTTTTSLR